MRNIYLNACCVEPATQVHALQYRCALISLNMEAARFSETSVNFYLITCHYFYSSEIFIRGFIFQNRLGTESCVISKILGRQEFEGLRPPRHSAQESDKFVSPKHQPHRCFLFLLEPKSTLGPQCGLKD